MFDLFVKDFEEEITCERNLLISLNYFMLAYHYGNDKFDNISQVIKMQASSLYILWSRVYYLNLFRNFSPTPQIKNTST